MRCPIPEAGVALIGAIFVLVVLGALGGFMVTLSGSQHYTILGAWQGARALHAARSGLEFGVARVLAGGCAAATAPVAFAAYPDFSVTVDCSQSAYWEQGRNYKVFQLTVKAVTSIPLDRPGFAQRSLSRSIIVAR